VLARTVLPVAGKVPFAFVSFGDQILEAIDKGRLDLMPNTDDGYLPSRFASEAIFEDGFTCVAARESKHPRLLKLKQCLAASHVGVGILGGQPTIADKRVAGIGEMGYPRKASLSDLGSLL
jgi:hypothetical protein